MRQIAPDILSDLRNAARIEGAWLVPFTSQQAIKQVESLIDEGSRVQFSNPDFRRELADWLRPSGDREGVPRHAIGGAELPDFTTSLIPFLLRTFDLGGKAAVRNIRLAARAPLLACLGTARDDPLAWLNAGQALQRLLLTATSHRLHASFLNQPIEVVKLRPRLLTLIERRGQPQILLRLGRGTRRTHTPRRRLDEVMAI
ncbi:MAG: nitroreductase family protein [Betaproteobacteria bacterium]|nr:nitroreductase family protein [Betaproteobacteria bacterium]